MKTAGMENCCDRRREPFGQNYHAAALVDSLNDNKGLIFTQRLVETGYLALKLCPCFVITIIETFSCLPSNQFE